MMWGNLEMVAKQITILQPLPAVSARAAQQWPSQQVELTHAQFSTTVQSVVGDMGDTGNSGTPFTVGITDSRNTHGHFRRRSFSHTISAGDLHTCAILDNGSASCWGNTEQMGNGNWLNSPTPTLVGSFGVGRTAVAISAGQAHTCVILDNGSVSCWGHGSYGRLGTGDTEQRLSPTLVEGLGQGQSAIEISSGFGHRAQFDGSVWCWGWILRQTWD